MVIKTFGKYLKPYALYCVIGPLAKLLEAVLELILPLLMAQVIDGAVTARDTGVLLSMGGKMLGIVGIGLCSALVCQYMASLTSQGFGTELRKAVFEHIGRLSPKQIDSFSDASLLTRLTGDINQLQVAVAMLIRLVIRAPFLCIGGVVMAASIDWRLSLVIVAAIPLFAGILWAVSGRSVPLHRKVQEKLDRLTQILSENLSGVRVIRAFAKRKDEQKRFERATKEHTDVVLRASRLSAILNPATTLVMNLAILCILWFGNIRVAAGGLTTGEVVAFINYVNQILVALTVVANMVSLYSRSYACAGRVAKVLNTEPELTDGKGASPSPTADAMRFDDVSFSYNTGANDIDHVSFTVPRGSTVGIIGGTGSGKSTLLSLMMRFYDVSAGSVTVEGADVREYRLSQLREKFALVSQKIELFSGTVADNIRFGCRDASDRDVVDAAVAAQADEFIRRLPGGYGARIERGGANLSGGQRQRLAIARALCRHARFLLLDDASSALDFATEAGLRAAVSRLRGETTVIIVSQRVSAVKSANLLLVMDEGRLADAGTHEQLLGRCALYRDIVSSQEQDGEAIGA